MAISPSAFLSIEQSLSKRLESAWENVATSLMVKVATLVEQGKWQEAYDEVYALDLTPVFEGNKEYIKYATYSALLFGASRLTNRLEQSAVANRSWSDIMPDILEVFRLQVVHTAGEQVRKAMLRELDRMVDEARQEQIISVTKAEDRILKPFQTFDKTGLGQMQLISQLHTSRVSAFGFTVEADVLAVEEYAVSEQLDNRVCPVCAAMHGKKFRVDDARGSLNKILRVKDPNELKTLQAWPKQDEKSVEELRKLSSSDIVARNWHIPPYHPWCRGLLVHVKKVPKLKPQQVGVAEAPPVPEEVTPLSFQQLGVEISEPAMVKWNQLVAIPPSTFLAKVSARPEVKFQHDLFRNGEKPSLRSAGISKFKVGDDGVVVVAGLLPGARLKHWEVELRLLDRVWQFNRFTAQDYDRMKELLTEWYDYFGELGLTLANT